MSTKTVSQMEAVLMDKIVKAKDKLNKLQQKHKLEIGSLAYQYGLQKFNIKQIEKVLARAAKELIDD